jgi:hypothetical protein
MHCFDNVDFGTFRHCTFAKFAEITGDPDKLYPRTLISLLDKFRDKECEVPRDRIYSLLSLCSEFQLPEVNYDQSDEDLAYDVLKRSDEPLCICTALLVAQTLCLSNKQHSRLDYSASTGSSTFIEFDIKGLRFARHAMLCNDQIHSWAHYKLMGSDIFGHDHVFSKFCPAFEILMDTLQARAMGTGVAAPSLMNNSNPKHTGIPFILKMMDERHRLAMLSGFGPALVIKSHDLNPDISTVQVALHLLVELIPQSIQLCSRVAHRKDRAKERNIDEVNPMPKRSGSYPVQSTQTQEGTDRRKWSEDFHRVDSANATKYPEDEGPISKLRLRHIQYAPE